MFMSLNEYLIYAAVVITIILAIGLMYPQRRIARDAEYIERLEREIARYRADEERRAARKRERKAAERREQA